MSSAFSPSYLSLLSPPAGLCEERGVSQHSDSASGSVPFLLYPPGVDGLGLYQNPLLPYLSPFHPHGPFGIYECPFEPAFIQKRNERERQRVKCVNQGYAKLRDHLPGRSADKRLSKVETLRAAIRYIKYLQGLVEEEEPSSRATPTTSSPAECGGESEG
ncbi:achaete-scute homolog 5-like [Acanthochromis polyacanthus]|uniref:Achaete-scute family bHLH transcription factor 5 n=1 Tax=Acanthochromis polyacanthus TaxID=80966 RepID=A0A3Q1ETM4_9TELE|nr:achaete-scute homolog 5-like [Acanthochromis polyacanthus]